MKDREDAQVVIRPLGRPGDLGWVVMAHGEVYADEFGWDATFEALVARIVADYAAGHDPTREAAWIAELDGRRVGCVFCVAAAGADDAIAKLRILLVHPDGRGRGIGGRLVDSCVAFARAAGYARMRLWTNHPLVAARRLYLERGFTLTEEEPHHSFGVDLVGQSYELDLRRPSRAAASSGYDRLVPDRLHFTDSDEANALIASNAMALLVGFVLDQQVTVQKAFAGPLALKERLGTLDAATLAEADLEPVFRAKPAIHRFPGSMAQRVRDLAVHVRDRYDGDAARIWTDAPDADALRANLAALPGFGEMKIKALGAVLAKRFGVEVARDLVPWHPTLGDVDSPQALADYQAAKRVHKAEWSKAQAPL